MDINAIVTEIDAQIGRLKQARELLTGIGNTGGTGTVKGTAARSETALQKPQRKKRVLSEEARARIAAAQKKRWAEKKPVE